jgi:hemerythrin superfamily protein
MVTRTGNRSSTPRNRSSNRDSKRGGSRSSSSDRSAFNWGDSGALVGAAIAGAAIAVAANLGRKAAIQGLSASAGDWDEVLAAEHDATMLIFDKLLATEDSQTFRRTMLVKKLTHSLDKHAHEEEHVVYPALREANEAHDADVLEGEHGYVKTFLYDLNEMEKSSSDFLPKVREFRAMVEAHARMEEEQVFPRFKRELSDEQNARITSLVNKEGFKMA